MTTIYIHKDYSQGLGWYEYSKDIKSYFPEDKLLKEDNYWVRNICGAEIREVIKLAVRISTTHTQMADLMGSTKGHPLNVQNGLLLSECLKTILV